MSAAPPLRHSNIHPARDQCSSLTPPRTATRKRLIIRQESTSSRLTLSLARSFLCRPRRHHSPLRYCAACGLRHHVDHRVAPSWRAVSHVPQTAAPPHSSCKRCRPDGAIFLEHRFSCPAPPADESSRGPSLSQTGLALPFLLGRQLYRNNLALEVGIPPRFARVLVRPDCVLSFAARDAIFSGTTFSPVCPFGVVVMSQAVIQPRNR